MKPQRALVVGHFSTVGDVDCLALVRRNLDRAGMEYEIAAFGEKPRAAIPMSVSPSSANPHRYTHLIFVCGPCFADLFWRAKFDLEDWNHCSKIGVNLTMLQPVADWNPFDILIERDSDRASRPDISFLADTPRVPVVGRCIIESQKEYGARARHANAIALLDDAIASRDCAAVEIDTRWPSRSNRTHLKSPAAVNGLISKVDVLLTNRLHGLVFALRQGVPVVAVDSIEGGDKLTRQADTIGWPCCFAVDTATNKQVREALDWCLRDEARIEAMRANERARNILADFDDTLTAAIAASPSGKSSAISPSPNRQLNTFAKLLRRLRF